MSTELKDHLPHASCRAGNSASTGICEQSPFVFRQVEETSLLLGVLPIMGKTPGAQRVRRPAAPLRRLTGAAYLYDAQTVRKGISHGLSQKRYLPHSLFIIGALRTFLPFLKVRPEPISSQFR